jgi:hypothetical protein
MASEACFYTAKLEQMSRGNVNPILNFGYVDIDTKLRKI